MNLFIQTIPRQKNFNKDEIWNQDAPKGKELEKVDLSSCYETVNCDYLWYDKPCCFPLIPVINGFTEQDEEITIISVIISDLPQTKENLKVFYDMIEPLREQRNLRIHHKTVEITKAETLENDLSLFTKVIELFNEGDTIYWDMTYGSKPQMYPLILAVNFAQQAMRNCHLACIVYGQMDFATATHPRSERKIYDMTPMFLTDMIIGEASHMRIKDPAKYIRNILAHRFNEEFGDE